MSTRDLRHVIGQKIILQKLFIGTTVYRNYIQVRLLIVINPSRPLSLQISLSFSDGFDLTLGVNQSINHKLVEGFRSTHTSCTSRSNFLLGNRFYRISAPFLSIYLTSLCVIYVGEVASHKSMTIGQVWVYSFISLGIFIYSFYLKIL